MIDDLPVAAVADTFWELLGCEPQYPCDLEKLLLWDQPVDFGLTFDALPNLDLAAVKRYALRRRMQYRVVQARRRQHGFLLADSDGACVLYEANDPVDEQRFTKAHEVAHFLIDYYLPRRRGLELLGESSRGALEGSRAPNQQERLHAAMAQVRLGVLENLTERTRDNRPSTRTLLAEDRADRIALELLAPAELVLKRLERAPRMERDQQLQWLAALLQADFGLPKQEANEYAHELIAQRGGSALFDWLASNV
jgi:Zn-dependent peptidase ImmA (M78 family)